MAAQAAAVQARVLAFRVGGRRLALAASEVAEVLRGASLTRVPHAPAALSGVTSVRGRVVPVVSMARLLGEEDQAQATSARIILLDRTPAIGLQVDEVTSLADTAEDAGEARRGQLIEVGGGAARLIDLDAVLDREFGSLARTSRAVTAQMPARQSAAEEADSAAALLTFDLADQAYALALEHVQEATAVPAEIARMPRSDEAMLGAFSWRGGLLPAVSLRSLLGLPPAEARAGQRMIIARIGEATVGLLVDRLRAIVRAPASAIGAVPQVLNRGAGEARIAAILRSADGQGLVSILAPDRLFQDQSLAQILADGRQERRMAAQDQAADKGESYVVFRLGAEEYGLPIGAVEEVVNLPERLPRLPRSPDFVAGVMSLRGKVVPVVDQRRRFGVEGETPAGRRRVIVTTIGDLRAGFAVDQVSEILQLTEGQLRSTPELTAEAGRLFERIAELDGGRRMILLVNPQQLLDRAESDMLAAMSDAAAAPGP